MPEMADLTALYGELDHLDGAAYVITETLTRCAEVLAKAAANEPDQQIQRRTVLSALAHQLRLARR